MKAYNKLVRDNIPEIIAKDGKVCHTRILSDEEFKKYAFAKLLEESKEANESQSAEELADLEEVVLTAAKSIGCSRGELEKIRLAKSKRNGAFEKKILLIDVKESK
ncbi:MAG: nucleoside triphosphate pyrophosphohydrolase [Bacilli bacterium]|jgi:predicted house-cleaning noncanonical NTP pyrophosphatase (MazG superfamily)|nr:nucleoside triphosphate pyrophosphohydrolase [Bacilli bacterium]